MLTVTLTLTITFTLTMSLTPMPREAFKQNIHKWSITKHPKGASQHPRSFQGNHPLMKLCEASYRSFIKAPEELPRKTSINGAWQSRAWQSSFVKHLKDKPLNRALQGILKDLCEMPYGVFQSILGTSYGS